MTIIKELWTMVTAVFWVGLFSYMGVLYYENFTPVDVHTTVGKIERSLDETVGLHSIKEKPRFSLTKNTPVPSDSKENIIMFNLVTTPAFEEYSGYTDDDSARLVSSRVERALSRKYNIVYGSPEFNKERKETQCEIDVCIQRIADRYNAKLVVDPQLHAVYTSTVFTMRFMRASDGAIVDIKTDTCKRCSTEKMAKRIEKLI